MKQTNIQVKDILDYFALITNVAYYSTWGRKDKEKELLEKFELLIEQLDEMIELNSYNEKDDIYDYIELDFSEDSVDLILELNQVVRISIESEMQIGEKIELERLVKDVKEDKFKEYITQENKKSAYRRLDLLNKINDEFYKPKVKKLMH